MYDIESHGRTALASDALAMAVHTEDAFDVLSFHGHESAFVVSHSAGSFIAERFAHHYPDKAHRLAMFVPQSMSYPSDVGTSWIRVSREDFRALWYSWMTDLGGSRTTHKAVKSDTDFTVDERQEELVRYFQGILDSSNQDVGGVETWS